MLPSLEEAQRIWQEGFDYRCATTSFTVRDEYIFHPTGVAKAAQQLAEHLHHLNPQKAYILGLLHDYGKKYDERATGIFHAKAGFVEISALGYDEVAKICLTHSFPNKDFKSDIYASCKLEWLSWSKQELSKVE